MIDGIANYSGDATIEKRCRSATHLIDGSIEEMLRSKSNPHPSMISVLTGAGQRLQSIRANIKLAISGGQNEPRDAIAGTVAALLSQPEKLTRLNSGDIPWLNAFEEYARWKSRWFNFTGKMATIRFSHRVPDFS